MKIKSGLSEVFYVGGYSITTSYAHPRDHDQYRRSKTSTWNRDDRGISASSTNLFKARLTQQSNSTPTSLLVTGSESFWVGFRRRVRDMFSDLSPIGALFLYRRNHRSVLTQ